MAVAGSVLRAGSWPIRFPKTMSERAAEPHGRPTELALPSVERAAATIGGLTGSHPTIASMLSLTRRTSMRHDQYREKARSGLGSGTARHATGRGYTGQPAIKPLMPKWKRKSHT
jgi:hypothetical protein